MKNRTFVYGKYVYQYKEIREDRKTLSLTVRPDMKIILKVPISASNDKIEAFLKRKWSWLEKQLRFFKKYQKKVYVNEYVSGESFLYLGRQYKLKVVKGEVEGVTFTKGNLILTTRGSLRNGSHNQLILEYWYNSRMHAKFKERYAEVLKLFDYDFEPKLTVRKMTKRWGSYLSGKKIILNPELIKASTDCIDYVITHELCHMKYKKHNADFYEYLESKISNWERLKEKLELLLV